MIGHIGAMFRDWGDAKRRIWRGRDGHPITPHVDGWAQSFAGKLREEGEGATEGYRRQRFDEVFVGAALDVRRAMEGVDEELNCAAHIHYVIPGPLKTKIHAYAETIGKEVSTRDHFLNIDRLHYYVAGRLDVCTKKSA